MVQCPRCGLLVDVPTLNDLQSLTNDGTYVIGEVQAKGDPNALRKMHEAYARTKIDEHGNEIDLRLSAEQIAKAGDIPKPDEARPRPVAPRYDPVTGLLVRPIEVQADEETYAVDSGAIPVVRNTLSYASPRHAQEMRLLPISVALLSPGNLTSQIFVWMVHWFITFVWFIIALIGFFFLIPVQFLCAGWLFAHYANVIEDTGPDDRDELPRLGRHMSFSDDLWRPFVNVMMAVAFCYGIPLLIIKAAPFGPMPSLTIGTALGLVGTVLFPAALLTSTTSGTVLNLRPDRVLQVIGEIGFRYLNLVILYILAGIVYYYGMFGSMGITALLFASGKVSWFVQTALGLLGGLGLPLGIYLMHYFCWALGLTYRTHHARFNWVLQRHVRAPRPGKPMPPSLAAKLPAHVLGQKLNH